MSDELIDEFIEDLLKIKDIHSMLTKNIKVYEIIEKWEAKKYELE